MFPSFGLRENTSTNAIVWRATVYVAVTEKSPRPGAPRLAVVKPSASTRPLVSEILHCTLASNTLASPLIVTGEVSVALVNGDLRVIAPLAEGTEDGTGDGGGDAAGDGEAAPVPAPPHAANVSAKTRDMDRLIPTSTLTLRTRHWFRTTTWAP